MTESELPELLPTEPISPPQATVEFPLEWLLDHASGPLQYRSLVDVAQLPGVDSGSVDALPLAHAGALTIAMTQSRLGTWNDSMLGVPAATAKHFSGIGTISAVRRLLEYGWDRDSPPLVQARRTLFRLLAEDDDPGFLFELGGKHAKDEDRVHRGRTILREAAAAALAQAGYEGDPRLRGAAKRIIHRVDEFMRSPLAEKPFMRSGNRHVLAPDAAPPSIYVLTMLAHMPLIRSEHHTQVDRLFTHLSMPMPRQESVQMIGSHIIVQPQLVLGDPLPHRNAADADVPFSLFWLETMARLGFLKRHDGWSKLFDRFLDDRNRERVWHPHKGMEPPVTTHPWVWSTYPLEVPDAPGESVWTDITFRLGLIARLSGHPIELV
ncbi:MAG TPA: hypothetical protein VFG84_07085 [Gemmatimonadaceae bacterium]|nr:hypothetical protein [Gemmatimonadaceae bacterium]